MPVYSADLPQVLPVSFLWALPAVPALAALKLALAGRWLTRRFGAGATGALAVVGIGVAVGLAMAAAVLHVVTGHGRSVLVEARGFLVDAGALQIAATATFGWLAAAAAVLLAATGLAAAASVAAHARDRREDASSRLAALCGVVSGGLAALVADDLVCVLVAWEVLVLSTLALARAASGAEPAEATRRGAEALVVSRAGQLAWLAGAALVFWGLGGELGERAGVERGRMTVTADVGAAAGADMELRTIGDRPTTAAVRPIVVGPTLSLTEVGDQLALRGPDDLRPFDAAFAARRFGPLPLGTLAIVLLLLGAAGLTAAIGLGLPRRGSLGPAALGFVPALLPGWVLAARVLQALTLSRGFLWVLGGPFVIAVFLFVRWRDGATARRVLRELGVVPAGELAAGADALERRVLAPATPVLAAIAVVAAIALLGM